MGAGSNKACIQPTAQEPIQLSIQHSAHFTQKRDRDRVQPLSSSSQVVKSKPKTPQTSAFLPYPLCCYSPVLVTLRNWAVGGGVEKERRYKQTFFKLRKEEKRVQGGIAALLFKALAYLLLPGSPAALLPFWVNPQDFLW